SQLVVFDIRKQAVISRLAIPNVHGVTVASDLGRVYAADVTDRQIDVIDEHSLRVIATIQLGLLPCSFAPCETPDALEYDAVDHKIFISGNGTDNAHQDISVIDTRANLFAGVIPLGQDQFGDSIGHPQYDPSSHRLYVAVQPQPKPAPAAPTPAPGTPAPVPFPPAQFVTIDPASGQVLGRVAFDPHTCTDPHGLVIDSAQHVAF